MSKKSPPPPRPTDSELAIMRVLWDIGPSSVRDVLEALNARREQPLAYTTVLRFLQIMIEKRLVIRDERERGHVYQCSVPADQTKRHLVRDLMDRLFDGSAHELVVQALGAHKVSRSDIREIRKLLDNLEP
jgi:BlaI family transcriptional regulator, penicillinase repressor